MNNSISGTNQTEFSQHEVKGRSLMDRRTQRTDSPETISNAPKLPRISLENAITQLSEMTGKEVHRGRDIKIRVTEVAESHVVGEPIIKGHVVIPYDYFGTELLQILQTNGIQFVEFLKTFLQSQSFANNRSVRSRLMQYGLMPVYDANNMIDLEGGIRIPVSIHSLNPYKTTDIPEVFDIETFCLVDESRSVKGEELAQVARLVHPSAKTYMNGHGETLLVGIDTHYVHIPTNGTDSTSLKDILALESHFDRNLLDARVGLSPTDRDSVKDRETGDQFFSISGTYMAMPQGYCSFVVPDHGDAVHLPSLYLGESVFKEHRWEFLGTKSPERVELKIYRK